MATVKHLIGMNVFVGPLNTGKSHVNMRMLNFLGAENRHLGTQKGGNYLCSRLRDDAESSSPVTATLAGKKFVSFKEIPAKPFQAEMIKNLMDPQDGNVDARHNISKLDDVTSFPVTMVLSGAKNSSVQVACANGVDTGCDQKISEVDCGYNLVGNPDPRNVTQRLADVNIPELCSSGALDGEMFFWAKHMYTTIEPSVCKTRHMAPLPRGIVANFKRQSPGGSTNLKERLIEWFDDNTQPCHPKDALTIADMQSKIEMSLGKLDATVFSAAGKAQKGGQLRVRVLNSNHYIYKHQYKTGDVRGEAVACTYRAPV